MPEREEASDAAAIEFRNVSLSFDGKQALRDVSFTLRRGQMLCVTGASASGKSVMLRLAIGLLKPDSGHIFIDGRQIDTLGENELLNIRGGLMGMVFQEDSLFTGLSVYDNAAYRLAEHGWSEADTERVVREALSFVGLEEDMEKLPEELSGGMRRRLEIARAIIGWPSIMLFDEPTAGLDPINEMQVLDLIVRARDLRGISSLFVTKQIHEISYLATHRAEEIEGGRVEVREVDASQLPGVHVLLLHKGEIVFLGTPAEFSSNTKPAVTFMTHARDAAIHPAAGYIANPWDKRRKLKGSNAKKRVGP